MTLNACIKTFFSAEEMRVKNSGGSLSRELIHSGFFSAQFPPRSQRLNLEYIKDFAALRNTRASVLHPLCLRGKMEFHFFAICENDAHQCSTVHTGIFALVC